VRLIEVLIEDAVRAGATDLHIEPEEKVVRIRHRIDGVLAHIKLHATAELARSLLRVYRRIDMDYDWSLNDAGQK